MSGVARSTIAGVANPSGLVADIGIELGRLELRVPIEVAPGEVIALVGPNGAGKSTVLNALSGLVALKSGSIELDGVVVDDPATGTFVVPESRRVGVMFQDYLLFDHLSVSDNVAFGPRSRGADRGTSDRIAREWLERVGLSDKAGVRPTELSGGQAQRVALARALATEPELLLLDEPLAALDATTRSDVRRDLLQHLRSFGGPTVLVTHDPLDALVLADRLVIIEDGRVTQEGPVAEVSRSPRTPYVAELFGLNLLRGVANGTEVALDGTDHDVVTIAEPASGSVLLVIRPTSISLFSERPSTSARNCWRCTITGLETSGDRVRVHLQGAAALTAEVTAAAVSDMGLVEGAELWASLKATDIAVTKD